MWVLASQSQGGVLPAIDYLHSAVQPWATQHSSSAAAASPAVDVVFARTYTPPRSLLLNNASRPWACVHDLPGTDAAALEAYLGRLPECGATDSVWHRAPRPRRVYVVAPATLLSHATPPDHRNR